MHFPRTYIFLDVDDTDRSAAFYEALLGGPPVSRSADTTIFEFDAPPLVLTLETRSGVRRARNRKRSGVQPSRKSKRSSVSDDSPRFALVVPEPEHVGKAAVALWRAGARLRLQDQGIEARDPDGNAWRVRFVPFAKGRTVASISREDGDERR
jgi:catechol 2,3-dioxygenase-like lactoylglutathione lyase family enzyme